MTSGVPPTFGDLLRRQRTAAGLTQSELAERADLLVRGINDLERGVRRTPRRDTLALLADALGLQGDACAAFVAAGRRSSRTLGEEAWAAAVATGQALTLDEAITEALATPVQEMPVSDRPTNV